jgi:hypothetical protein
LGDLKSGLYSEHGILFSKGGSHPNAYFKYFAIVGSTLLVFLFVSDVNFGDNESNSRFNGSLYENAIYAPRLEEIVATEELRFTRDVTPANRVNEGFAQFVPNKVSAGNVTPPLLQSFGSYPKALRKDGALCAMRKAFACQGQVGKGKQSAPDAATRSPRWVQPRLGRASSKSGHVRHALKAEVI